MAQVGPPRIVCSELELRRFSVDEYHRMIEAGILEEGDRVELLEGLLVKQMVRNPRHDLALSLTEEALNQLLPGDWFCRIQSAITTADSEPEPDLAIVRGPRRRYADQHPRPSDVGLVVEVSDASLGHDRVDKARLYARAGIACYWIVNVVERVLEVYMTPDRDSATFTTRSVLASGTSVTLELPGASPLSVSVADLLP